MMGPELRATIDELELFEKMFNQIQLQHMEWVQHNFPNQPKHHGLLGAVEEIGELAHAHLKAEQGIRHSSDELIEQQCDALGDIIIFLMSYCNSHGLSLGACLVNAWKEVKERDWILFPKNGRTE